ncbi:GNAT family N-acetyltransferase [Mucilaginibacter xinganensis]|uniref:Ribosomal N-acetyltransferase YdaF, putative n=1 Tax=Mucilaginibacter xinganensis TaxID=1234841 RepID=A0A223NYM6_9SPHI|nr:GNAT family N-acetyltransferase [Mucilaginibacter xinganensis]ASU34671.1 ribosomal N-acetyltransferase YdaF, putative [Mucilaginibacter xinganensis]
MNILETERLLFRKHSLADKESYCAMEMDSDVRRFVGGYPRTREEAEKRFGATTKPSDSSLGMWATILKNEQKYIGRCGIYPHFDAASNPIEGEASLGLYIAKPYWGNGFATEAGEGFIEMGFNKLGLNRIVTMVQAGNNASVRVLEKLGFQLTSTEERVRTFYNFVLENAR